MKIDDFCKVAHRNDEFAFLFRTISLALNKSLRLHKKNVSLETRNAMNLIACRSAYNHLFCRKRISKRQARINYLSLKLKLKKYEK